MGSDRGKRVAHVGVTRHGAPPAPAGPDDPTSKPGAPGVGVGNADDTMPAESAPDSAEARGASARPAAGATAPPPTPPTEPRPSGSISRYQFGPELGRGGMGRVVEATDTRLGRKVAVKEALPRGLDLRRRFEREVRITARLEHPSIVPLYDAGTSADGNPFYVMRKVSGRPLDKLIADARTLSDRLTLVPNLLAAIDAIAHAHNRDVVHRDMKPANVLVGEHGETVVIDWGLAKALGEDDDDPVDHNLAPSDAVETQIGAVFGTPGFMAPEQARGESLDPRSDVYALGATLYQLLSGRPPHTGTSATEVIDRSLGERPPPLPALVPGVPAELVAIADKAMAFDRELRYRDAGALAEDVRRFLTGRLVAAHRYTPRQRIARFVRKHRAAVAVGALATVALAVAAVIAIVGIVHERDRAMRAEHAAQAGRRAAEEARDRERDRADELLITQARSLAEVNPTAAIAALKLVAPSSARLRGARMVAISAAARGAAWGYPGHGRITSTLELAPDGRRLLTAGDANGFRIHDLDRHDTVVQVDFTEAINATWIAGGDAVLVAPSSGGLLRFDAHTGARRAIAWPGGGDVDQLAATEAGDRVFFVDDPGVIHQLDVAAGTAAPLAIREPGRAAGAAAEAVRDLAVAPAGGWLLAGSTQRCRVIRLPDGAVLGAMPGQCSSFAIAGDGRTAAAVVDGKVARIAVGPDRATFALLDPEPPRGSIRFPLQVVFRGDMMLVTRIGGTVEYLDKHGAWQQWIARSRYALMFGAEASGSLVAFVDQGGQLVVVTPYEVREIRAPSEVQLKLVAARPDSRYIAVAADDLVLVWDIGRMAPAYLTIDDTQAIEFRDDHTLITTPHEGTWEAIDVRSSARTPLDTGLGFNNVIWMEAADDGRLLIQTIIDDALLAFAPGEPRATRLATGRHVRVAVAIPGGGYAYGTTTGEVSYATSEADRRIVHKEPSPIDSLTPAGAGVGVQTAAGVHLRLDADGREVGRVEVAGANPGAFAIDDTGRFLIGVGDRIMAWNGTRLDELVALDTAVVTLLTTPYGIVAGTRSGLIYAIGADLQPRRLLSRTQGIVRLARRGGMLLASLADRRIVVVDLESTERALLPPTGLLAYPAISPDGRRIAYYVPDRGIALWYLDAPLETAPDGWAPWLDEVTNAMPSTTPDVVWPWQVR
jgi:hypothetical protein